jgi:pilus assembly protein CpaF
MFSKYKKPSAKPVAAPAAEAKEKVTTIASAAPAAQTKVARKAPPKADAQVVLMDKERKRKERVSDLKLELHRVLLDSLNLAALEHATESDLRQEIQLITSEFLEDKAIILNREDRQTLNKELYDEVTGLGPLETLLQDDTVNDILVNGPQQIFVERAGKLQLTDITFKDERHLLRIIDKIVSAVGRRVD